MRRPSFCRALLMFHLFTSLFQWVYSLTYVGGFIYLAFQDDQFRTETPFLTLDTKTNAIFKLVSNYLNIGLDVGSVVIDLVTAVVNKGRIKAYASAVSQKAWRQV